MFPTKIAYSHNQVNSRLLLPAFVSITPPLSSSHRTLAVDVFATGERAAHAAANAAAAIIRTAVHERGHARIMVGTGNSQLAMIRTLVRLPEIDWSKVEAFHLDEYVGLSADHPASFRRWIRREFADMTRPRAMHYIEGDATDLEGAMREYGRCLLAAPVDLAFVGIGENGHIAFNDPHVADFKDAEVVKRVVLDEDCRRQQVGEGHFPALDRVPKEAVTVTCTGLYRALHWICCVPDQRKARAIKGSLEGPLSTACPGSLVRLHPSAALFLDAASASSLSADYLRANCRTHGTNPPTANSG